MLPNFRGSMLAAGGALMLAISSPAAAADCGAEYTIQPGDTLSRIASRCGSSVEALMDANPQVTSPAKISVGWKLSVPGAEVEKVAAVPEAIPSEPMSLRGWITNGRRCAMLETPEGDAYGVVSPELSFTSGRPVAVEGRLVDDPTCSGPKTLLVTGLSTTEL